ncbi:hypothetical protein Leryth_019974 [Lithospermum erythrorhizon]|nr:hypothetical protein Leryth_019974 [Lithospermum erythrorhizon]
MSPFVFVVYTNALASVILLPSSFMANNQDKVQRPLFTSHLLWRVFLLGLIGVTIAQNLAFAGLFYSSPIVAISMANIVPALSFMLTAMLRSRKIDWQSVGSLAKTIGSLISMMGAISVTYMVSDEAIHLHYILLLRCQIHGVSSSLPKTQWAIVLTTVFAVFVERDPKAWKLELNLELIVIVLTAIFQSLIRSNIQLWCTRKKGPHFVAAFKPFGIIVASICGCTIFADTFHYGSMLSAFICGLGYYTLVWGNIRDEEPPKDSGNNHGGTGSTSSSQDNLPDEKVPLLVGEEVV